MTSMAPRQVRKRDGRVVPFDPGRIAEAVFRAARETRRPDRELAEEIAGRVLAEVGERSVGAPAEVEDIQDAVERALMTTGHADVAKAYVVYRRRRAELREAKRALGVRDELKLSLNAATVLKERYLRRDDDGHVVESTAELMDRVARHVAAAEDEFVPGSSGRWEQEFAALLRRLDFLPNSPTLMNAGTALELLSACFVLPVLDSLDSIFSTLRVAALVHQAGGGTGFSFSRIRPAGDRVASTGGVASGPLAFMRVYDTATDVIKQGGRRRGANMAVLDVSHPDIREFVTVKNEPGRLENFNLSVGVPDSFMLAVEQGGAQPLVNPRTGRQVQDVPASELFGLMAESAWRSGDPGLLFLDRANRDNPVPSRGRIEATNPCGEVPLLPYESCTLGSLNLARFAVGDRVDWERLGAAARLAVRFLDDVIEVSRYPAPEIEQAVRATRKIGVGVMGLAELLASIGVPYDSEEAVHLGGTIMEHVQREARRASVELAAERGAFPLFEQSVFAARREPPPRNAQLTAIAPTGTISVIAGTTSGIEPMFAIVYVRNVLGTRLIEVNPLFERVARERGFYSDDLMADLVTAGGVRGSSRVPEDVRRAFPSAHEIAPVQHLRMQAAVQRHVDAAVSKTVNLPADAGVDDVKRTYLDAWRAGLKGITVYRYGSRPGQVLSFLGTPPAGAPLGAGPAYAGGCAGHECEF